jgi:magnesium transporter
VHLTREDGELVTGAVAAFVTRSALVTVRKDDQFPIDGVLTRWDDNADLTKHRIGALVYGLLDFVVDGHFDAVQSSTIRSSSSRT